MKHIFAEKSEQRKSWAIWVTFAPTHSGASDLLSNATSKCSPGPGGPWGPLGPSRPGAP